MTTLAHTQMSLFGDEIPADAAPVAARAAAAGAPSGPKQVRRIWRFLIEISPARFDGLAHMLPAHDMDTIDALRALGHVHQMDDGSGREFVLPREFGPAGSVDLQEVAA